MQLAISGKKSRSILFCNVDTISTLFEMEEFCVQNLHVVSGYMNADHCSIREMNGVSHYC